MVHFTCGTLFYLYTLTTTNIPTVQIISDTVSLGCFTTEQPLLWYAAERFWKNEFLLDKDIKSFLRH